jgi:hypothetical protein
MSWSEPGVTARALLLLALAGGCDKAAPSVAPGSDTAAPAAPTLRLKSGKIYVTGLDYKEAGAPVQAVISGAHFFASRPASQIRAIGPCELKVKDRPKKGSPLPVPVEASAGAVTISGGKQPIALSPADKAPIYPRHQADTLPWKGGEVLEVKATGGEVPAFSAKVNAPGYVKVLEPSPPPPEVGSRRAIARDQDLRFRWAAAAVGDIVLVFGGATNDAWRELTCRFPGPAGEGIVPAAALKELPHGTGIHHGFATQTPKVQAGDWNLTLQVSTALIGPDGDQLYQLVDYR